MKRIRLGGLILLACIFVLQGQVCWGQQKEEKKAGLNLNKILKELSKSSKDIETLILKGTYVQDLQYMPKGGVKNGTIEIWFEVPIRARVVTKLGSFSVVSINDGEMLWYISTSPFGGAQARARPMVMKKSLASIPAPFQPVLQIPPGGAHMKISDFVFPRMYKKFEKVYEFTLKGKKKLWGNEVYLVSALPKVPEGKKAEDEGILPVPWSVWFDAKSGIIRRIRIPGGEEGGTISVNYREVEVNKKIPETMITFNPLPGLEVREMTK